MFSLVIDSAMIYPEFIMFIVYIYFFPVGIETVMVSSMICGYVLSVTPIKQIQNWLEFLNIAIMFSDWYARGKISLLSQFIKIPPLMQ